MATYTTYLNLEKPTTSETFNLLKMNQNWDKIDAGVSALNSKTTNYDYTLTDTDLFVKCRNGVVFIRTGDNCTNTMLDNVTLPSAYCHAYNAGYPCIYYNGSAYVNGFINVGTDGKLTLKDIGYSDATSTHIRAAITYMP